MGTAFLSVLSTDGWLLRGGSDGSRVPDKDQATPLLKTAHLGSLGLIDSPALRFEI